MPQTLAPTFGDLLKQLRKRAGMTQGDLAAAVGYSVSFVSVLEQNRRLPDVEAVIQIFVPALGLQDEPTPCHPAGRTGCQRAWRTTARCDHTSARNADRRTRSAQRTSHPLARSTDGLDRARPGSAASFVNACQGTVGAC